MPEVRGARSDERAARGEKRGAIGEGPRGDQNLPSCRSRGNGSAVHIAHRTSHFDVSHLARSTLAHLARSTLCAPRSSLVRRCAKGCAQGARPLPRPRALAARDPCRRCGPCPKRSAPPQTRARDRRVARPDLLSCTANHPHC